MERHTSFLKGCTGYRLTAISLLEADFEEAIMGGIEQMALQTGCKIFIVDNLTYCAAPWRKAMRQDG